jgi:copper chaperone NosL
MRNFFISVSLIIGLAVSSCSVEPEVIHYGDDQCSFCKMGVVDNTFSAQYVTDKGKQYKFDDIGCLIRELKSAEINEGDLAFVLVADFANPGKMIDVRNSFFVTGKEIHSPMRSDFAAVATKEAAKDFVANNGGKVVDWEGVKSEILK